MLFSLCFYCLYFKEMPIILNVWTSKYIMIFLFVCLGFFVPIGRIFHSCGDVFTTGEGLQILTYARHLWPLRSEGSLTCRTHYNTGQPYILVISEDQWHSHLLPSVWQWSCHCLFLRLRSVPTGDRTPISCERFISIRPRRLINDMNARWSVVY